MQRRVAVVGAGVGGLAAAAGLVRDGWDVTVHERAVSPAVDGTALALWPDAVRALDRLGLGEGLRERSTRQSNGMLRRPDGSRLGTIDVSRLERREGEAAQLVARPDLLALLASALPAGTVRHGDHVGAADLTALRRDNDLVLGADGIHSVLRGAVAGDRDRLRRTGTVAYRGVAELAVPVAGETWGRQARFGVTPHGPAGAARANWYAVLPTALVHHPAGSAADLDLLRAHFGDWHDPIPRVLDRAGIDGYLRHELADLHPGLRRYTDGRSVALLGDAAHAMTPDLGQGACQALLDGVALADAMRDRTVADGLAVYDRTRRRPTRRMATLAWWMHRVVQAPHGTRIRDLAVRTVLGG